MNLLNFFNNSSLSFTNPLKQQNSLMNQTSPMAMSPPNLLPFFGSQSNKTDGINSVDALILQIKQMIELMKILQPPSPVISSPSIFSSSPMMSSPTFSPFQFSSPAPMMSSQAFSPFQSTAPLQSNSSSIPANSDLQNKNDNVNAIIPKASNAPINKFNQAEKLGVSLGGGKLVTIKSKSGATFSVNEKLAPQFKGFVSELEARGYKVDPKTSGGYNYRKIANTNRWSQHAYGNAIDINYVDNALGKKGNLPTDIASIAAKYGISWGGYFKDPMHFEVAQLLK